MKEQLHLYLQRRMQFSMATADPQTVPLVFALKMLVNQIPSSDGVMWGTLRNTSRSKVDSEHGEGGGGGSGGGVVFGEGSTMSQELETPYLLRRFDTPLRGADTPLRSGDATVRLDRLERAAEESLLRHVI
jgi:hypothetical protein